MSKEISIRRRDLFKLWQNVMGYVREISSIADEYKHIERVHWIEQLCAKITAEFGKFRRRVGIRDWWELGK